MTVQVIKLKAEHLEQLLAQDHNAGPRSYFTEESIKNLENHIHTFSAVTATGRVVFCGGISHYWQGRGEVWGIFDQRCKKEFIAIHNAVKRFLETAPVRRIEATAVCGFEAGHRWLKALGFKLEAERMKAFTPDGRDASLYARVRDQHGI